MIAELHVPATQFWINIVLEELPVRVIVLLGMIVQVDMAIAIATLKPGGVGMLLHTIKLTTFYIGGHVVANNELELCVLVDLHMVFRVGVMLDMMDGPALHVGVKPEVMFVMVVFGALGVAKVIRVIVIIERRAVAIIIAIVNLDIRMRVIAIQLQHGRAHPEHHVIVIRAVV